MEWVRTWPDKPDDGTLKLDGNRLGRDYRMGDARGRWMWFSWCGSRPRGIAACREQAMADVERYADLATLEPTFRAGYVPQVSFAARPRRTVL